MRRALTLSLTAAAFLFAACAAPRTFGDGVTEIVADSGPGWRLLTTARGAELNSPAFMTSDQGLADWVDEVALGIGPGDVDFTRELVLAESVWVSDQCPDVSFRGLRVDGDTVEVDAERGDEPFWRRCDEALSEVLFVLAVERSHLPDRFAIDGLEVDLTEPLWERRQFWAHPFVFVYADTTQGPDATGVITAESENPMPDIQPFQVIQRAGNVLSTGGFALNEPGTITGYVANCSSSEDCSESPPVEPPCEWTGRGEAFREYHVVVRFTSTGCHIDELTESPFDQ